MTRVSETPDPSSEGSGVSLCSKCGLHPRAPKGSWCRPCRRGAQREYNTRVRPRPEQKTGLCQTCGAEMTWLSGRGADRVFCSRKCRDAAQTAISREKRRLTDAAYAERVDVYRRRRALALQGFKECAGCGEVKPFDDFHVRGGGHQSRCKPCVALMGRQRGRSNSHKSFKSHLKTKYGLTVEQWQAKLVEQSGRCAICNTPMREPNVDHDHQTGEFRGLLCRPCNIRLHDGATMSWFTDAMRYLRLTEHLEDAVMIQEALESDSGVRHALDDVVREHGSAGEDVGLS